MKEVWIGMAHVRPLPGCKALSEGARGAYGNVAALASSAEDFERAIKETLENDGLFVVEVEDTATYQNYLSSGRASEYLTYLHEKVSDDNAVQFHTFYNYDHDD